MFKQSFLIVAIQVIGIILGLMSIYLVAGDMGPEVYSLVGVHTVVAGIILPFSHLGVETTMMREALYWMEKGEIDKVKEYTTQSIISRFIGFAILLPFIVGYLIFLCYSKYDGNYLWILLSFYVGSCASALNDSMSLIIRAQGDFVFSQLAKTLNNNIVKFVAIIVYVKFGATPYLYFYCLVPIPLMLIFYIKIKQYLDLSFISLKGTFQKIKDSKNLWLRSYLDYFSNSADNLLVSILFPTSVMGLYTLYKNFENIVKQFIEGFFDVVMQNFVKYKGNVEGLIGMEKKANLARWGVILLVVFATIVFSTRPDYFISLANLTKYDGVKFAIYTVALVAVLYLIGKNEGNLVSLLGPSKTILKIGVFLLFVTIATYLSVVIMPSIYGVYVQRILFYAVMSIIGIVVFKRNRINYYSNIYK